MKFQSFDTPEEMYAALDRAARALDEAVQPWQADLKPGDFIMRWDEDSELVIYAQILDPGEPTSDREWSAEEMEEIRADGERYKQPEMRYRRFGRFWSVADPFTADEGELGTSHVALFDVHLTPEAFAAARAEGWPNDPSGQALVEACRKHGVRKVAFAARE